MNPWKSLTLIFQLSLLISSITKPVLAQSETDSLLREQLTRAVRTWQSGEVRSTYLLLDSILARPVQADLAQVMSRASIRTGQYLTEQKKLNAALPFIDSAYNWSNRFLLGEELVRSYEAYAAWWSARGNTAQTAAMNQLATKVRDSLQAQQSARQQDSITTLITGLETEVAELKSRLNEKESATAAAPTGQLLIYQLGLVASLLALVLCLIFLRRKKSAHPPASVAPAQAAVPEKPAEVHKVAAEPKASPAAEVAKPASAQLVAAAETKVLSQKEVNSRHEKIRELTDRLSEVELVLIRADVLSKNAEGENKVARHKLHEYLLQFPGIMGKLDEQVTRSSVSGIMEALNQLKPYLEFFGMSGTLVWVEEFERDSPEVKLNKLLSRVFQVRNHCRRAADEAKALHEKLS